MKPERVANEPLDSTPRQEARTALDNHFPSPLAGEGQGEGGHKTRERSEHVHSKLNTHDAQINTTLSHESTGGAKWVIR